MLLIVMGALTLLATLRAYLYPRLRNIEVEMPDKLPEATAAAEG